MGYLSLRATNRRLSSRPLIFDFQLEIEREIYEINRASLKYYACWFKIPLSINLLSKNFNFLLFLLFWYRINLHNFDISIKNSEVYTIISLFYFEELHNFPPNKREISIEQVRIKINARFKIHFTFIHRFITNDKIKRYK